MKKILVITVLALTSSMTFAQDIPPMPIFAQKDVTPTVEKKVEKPVDQKVVMPVDNKKEQATTQNVDKATNSASATGLKEVKSKE